MRRFTDLQALHDAEGEHLGVGEWCEIGQERVNAFAEATEDRQWIHVDPQRAAEGPFRTTIAHGFLTLSLLPRLTKGIYQVDNLAMAMNYGLNKVRFPRPVTVGSHVRISCDLLTVVHTPQGTQVTVKNTLEIEGQDRPGCVAETVTLMVAARW
jgi:acyl dehydratase